MGQMGFSLRDMSPAHEIDDAVRRGGAALGPGIVFTMRYPDDVGYVWRTIARRWDLVAQALGSAARCFTAFPALTGLPAYDPHWVMPIEADFYSYSEENRHHLASVIERHNIKVVVFASAEAKTVDFRFLRRRSICTVNTENNSHNLTRRNGVARGVAKYLLRRHIRWGLHDLYVPNSTSQRDFLLRYAHLPPSRVSVIVNGVDTVRFSPGGQAAAFRKTRLEPKRLWIMTASQARPEKRIEFVIEAARRILSARPDQNIAFVHVGDGECLPRWREVAAANDLGDRYRFVGYQADLVPFYRAASVFAHAATRESFGNVIAEAMSCGLPVVATRAGGPQEIVADGKTGFLLAPDDMEGFVSAIQRYLDDPVLREIHGRRGRERAIASFSDQRQATEFAELLRGRFSELRIFPLQ